MTQRLQNMMRREAEAAGSRKAAPCYGIVTSYDPGTYSAKVALQPGGQETGFLPIHSPWSGNGWGMFAPPEIGDVVEVNFQEDGKEAGMVGQRQFGNKFRPLPVPSGEFWLVHASGSSLKFKDDGTVEIHAATAIHSSAPIWNHTGNIIVTGEIKATGDIWDNYLTTGYTMASFRATYDSHTHNGIEPGGGTSAIPNQVL